MAEGNTPPIVEINHGENTSPSKVESEVYAASKKWRKQINLLQSKLVSERDTSILEKECEVLEQCMNQLTAAQEARENIQKSTMEKMALYRVSQKKRNPHKLIVFRLNYYSQ